MKANFCEKWQEVILTSYLSNLTLKVGKQLTVNSLYVGRYQPI